jgi:heme exporter protein A
MSGRNVSGDQLAQALRVLAIEPFSQWPAGHLSQGQKRRIALARLALAHREQIWILDEPFNALDRHGVETVNRFIEQHVGRGGTVALTTHQAWQTPVPVVRLELGVEAGA